MIKDIKEVFGDADESHDTNNYLEAFKDAVEANEDHLRDGGYLYFEDVLEVDDVLHDLTEEDADALERWCLRQDHLTLHRSGSDPHRHIATSGQKYYIGVSGDFESDHPAKSGGSRYA